MGPQRPVIGKVKGMRQGEESKRQLKPPWRRQLKRDSFGKREIRSNMGRLKDRIAKLPIGNE